jgi:hypothetical protein
MNEQQRWLDEARRYWKSLRLLSKKRYAYDYLNYLAWNRMGAEPMLLDLDERSALEVRTRLESIQGFAE